jgi:dihydrofolate reductase
LLLVNIMRKVILYIASSLDGFISRKDGRLDWLPQIEEGHEDYGYNELMEKIDCILMGRKTYEQVLKFGKWPYSGKKSYVFSKRKVEEDKNVEISSDAVSLVKELKQKDGKDIWLVGGGGLNGSLLNIGLIDEIIITVIPVLIGSGIGLFDKVENDCKLKLIESKSYDSGMVQLRYLVA